MAARKGLPGGMPGGPAGGVAQDLMRAGPVQPMVDLAPRLTVSRLDISRTLPGISHHHGCDPPGQKDLPVPPLEAPQKAVEPEASHWLVAGREASSEPSGTTIWEASRRTWTSATATEPTAWTD
eukprot:CAMPEP_0115138940 /NCGR_PEP_ID=MMETSP0227-20121206/57974_1 /TAXON_ID=89957 /ORGANISM="Polarella glacialis, Strain CCMP 1383" /LENGTH=123 /DNA_ID=CAMNT_0002546673 /DNA_START=130 /DNA_END=502 /DNA_ORIENTATION=-